MESPLFALYDKYMTAPLFVPPMDYAQNLKVMYKKGPGLQVLLRP